MILRMRRKAKDVHKDIQQQTFNALFETADLAARKGTIKNFIKELLTESELLMLGRRLLIARMLLSGLSQAEIRYKLRLSPNTIWKVNKWLVNQFPEYGEALKGVEKEREARSKSSKKIKSSYKNYNLLTFEEIKSKYPMHFLLFDLAGEIFKSRSS